MGKKQGKEAQWDVPQGQPEKVKAKKPLWAGCLIAVAVVLLVVMFVLFIIILTDDSGTDTDCTAAGTTTAATTEALPTYEAETKTVGHWEVTITGVETGRQISRGGLLAFNAEDGCKLVKVSMDVKNIGTETDTWGYDMNCKIVYGDYNYAPSYSLTEDEELSFKTCAPLATVSGYMLFNVSEEIIDSGESLSFSMSCDGETVTFVLW